MLILWIPWLVLIVPAIETSILSKQRIKHRKYSKKILTAKVGALPTKVEVLRTYLSFEPSLIPFQRWVFLHCELSLHEQPSSFRLFSCYKPSSVYPTLSRFWTL